MRKPKLLEDYAYLINDAVSPFGHGVVRQTDASSFIKDGAKLTAPLTVALKAYDDDVAALDHPTPAQTMHRDELRAEVVNQLNRLAKRLNLDYTHDGATLLSSGLTLADPNQAARAGSADAAGMTVTLLDGRTPGHLLVKMTRPTGTIQNLGRYNTVPGRPMEQWEVFVGGGREREIGPFPKGTEIEVVVAALTGSTTEPVYSAVVSRIVQ